MTGDNLAGTVWLGAILMLNGLYFAAYGPQGVGYFLMLLGIVLFSAGRARRPRA